MAFLVLIHTRGETAIGTQKSKLFRRPAAQNQWGRHTKFQGHGRGGVKTGKKKSAERSNETTRKKKKNPHNRQKRNRLCGWTVYQKHKNIDWAFRVFRVKLVNSEIPKIHRIPKQYFDRK